MRVLRASDAAVRVRRLPTVRGLSAARAGPAGEEDFGRLMKKVIELCSMARRTARKWEKAPAGAGAFVDLFAGQRRVSNHRMIRLTAPLPRLYEAPRSIWSETIRP